MKRALAVQFAKEAIRALDRFVAINEGGEDAEIGLPNALRAGGFLITKVGEPAKPPIDVPAHRVTRHICLEPLGGTFGASECHVFVDTDALPGPAHDAATPFGEVQYKGRVFRHAGTYRMFKGEMAGVYREVLAEHSSKT